MSNRSRQDPLSSLCLAAWKCFVYMCLHLSPLFPPSFCVQFLSVCLSPWPLCRALPFYKSAHWSVPAVSQRRSVGVGIPFRVGLIWSCASGRRGLILKGPSVDPLSSTERQTWWISDLLREAGTERPEPANKNCRPLSHSSTLVHSFPLPVHVIPSLSLICFLFCLPAGMTSNKWTCIFVLLFCYHP